MKQASVVSRIVWAAACFAAIMGFSRLAYGLLVPAMHAALGGGLDAYGEIGSANLAGYFVGSLAATRIAARPHRARSSVLALIAMCVAMAACGVTSSLAVLGLLRFLVGVASGVALTLTLSLAVERVAPAERGRAAAFVWAGGTVGMAIAGAGSLVVPLADPGWRIVWVAMALLGIAFALGFGFVARERGATRAATPDDGAPIGLWDRRKYRALAVGYAAYGFGYICVVTFFGDALVRAHVASLGFAVIVLGVSASLGALLWGPLLDRYRNGAPVAAASALCAVGAFALLAPSAGAVLVGAAVLGIGFIGVPAMVGALAQQREPAQRYARAFATITTTLGVGQIIGPFAGGLVASRAGSQAALCVGGAALVIGAVAFSFYRKPESRAPAP